MLFIFFNSFASACTSPNWRILVITCFDVRCLAPRCCWDPRPDLRALFLCRSLSQGSTNSNMLDVQGGAHKKRARRSSLLNAKKLYEDAQMARKVKQYLSNLNVETDEEKIQILSLQCEPAYSTRKCSHLWGWQFEMFENVVPSLETPSRIFLLSLQEKWLWEAARWSVRIVTNWWSFSKAALPFWSWLSSENLSNIFYVNL